MARSSNPHYLVAASVQTNVAAWDNYLIRQAILAITDHARHDSPERIPDPADEDEDVPIVVFVEGLHRESRFENITIFGTTADVIAAMAISSARSTTPIAEETGLVFCLGSNEFCVAVIGLLALRPRGGFEEWSHDFIDDLFAAKEGQIIWTRLNDEEDLPITLNHDDFERVYHAYVG